MLKKLLVPFVSVLVATSALTACSPQVDGGPDTEAAANGGSSSVGSGGTAGTADGGGVTSSTTGGNDGGGGMGVGADGWLTGPTLAAYASDIGAVPVVTWDATCQPLDAARAQPFVPAPPPSSLAEGMQAMQGIWVGHAVSPFGDGYAWDVALELGSDGHWRGRGYVAVPDKGHVQQVGPIEPFYYGDYGGHCDDIAQWRLEDMNVDKMYGQIDVPFYYSKNDCGLPGWQGELTLIALDAGGSRMQFDFSTDSASLITYDLYRVCTSFSVP